jgi:hypothetical protein
MKPIEYQTQPVNKKCNIHASITPCPHNEGYMVGSSACDNCHFFIGKNARIVLCGFGDKGEK